MHTNFAISFVDRKTIIRSTLNLLLLLYWTGHCVKRTNGRSTFHSSQVSLPTWTIFTAESVFAEEISRRRMDLHTYIYRSFGARSLLPNCHRKSYIVESFVQSFSVHVFSFDSVWRNKLESEQTTGCGNPKCFPFVRSHVKMIDSAFHVDFDWQKKKKNRHKKWNVTSSPQ